MVPSMAHTTRVEQTGEQERRAERRPRFFYGWVIVAGLSVVGAVNMSMGGINYGIFVAPMSDSLGVGRGLFGWAQTARMVATGAASPILGKMLDRHGSRVPLAIVGVLAALALVGMSQVSAGYQVILVMAFLGLIGMQGGGGLYTSVPVAKWFVRKRGRAMSFAFVGGPIALLLVLPLTQILVDQAGWRATWLIFGIGGGTVVSVIAVVLLRRQPEDLGLLPDGAVLEEQHSTDGEDATPSQPPLGNGDEYAWTRRQAIHSGAFWRMSLGFGLSMIGGGSFMIYRFDFFNEQGINATLTAFGAATGSLTVVATTLTMAFILDRLQLRLVSSLAALLLLLCVVTTMFTTTVWQMFAANVLFGIGMGLNVAAMNTMWPSYFGRGNIGSIRGIAMPLSMLFSGLGPPIVGMLRDANGTYGTAWLAAALPMTLGVVLLFFTPKPKPPVSSEPANTP
jgi:MFS family permease